MFDTDHIYMHMLLRARSITGCVPRIYAEF